MTIRLIGLYTPALPETRDLAILEVDHNNTTYQWQIYIPQGQSIQDYIDSKELAIKADIDAKEIEWANLSIKYREIINPFTNEVEKIDITREEVVKPEIPDYYAKRREAYPAIGDQLDALWRGVDSTEFQSLVAKIQEVKATYPK